MGLSNEYHLLSFIPATERWEMPPLLEAMAVRLVQSGRLRINADSERNFVKYSTVDSDRSFSARELNDPALRDATRATIAKSVPMGLGASAVDEVLEQLQRDLKKARGVDEVREMKVARVLMQAAHPAVMMLAIQEGAEFFVSYSHNVGDLMATHFWDSHGTASGLQSAQEIGSSIYVSCSGDPFFEGEDKTYTTDGWPALARMVVIAGQEIGHYADLIRARHGIIGRISAEMEPLAPSAACKAARDHDIEHLTQMERHYRAQGLGVLLTAENAVAFYDTRLKFSLRWLLCQCWRFLVWGLFTLRATPSVPRIRTYPAARCGTGFKQCLDDMTFNLSPNADAYHRADPVEEEAIACIEALARVPQQVNKWGHAAVRATTPHMYRLYYGTVIPNVTSALDGEALAVARGAATINLLQQLSRRLRRKFRKKPGWYPEKPLKNS